MFDVKPFRRRVFEGPESNSGAMVDPNVKAWAEELLGRDLTAFKEARKRFLRRPTGKRLHDVRTAARRMRSLFEDLSSTIGVTDLKDLKRAINASGAARDADVLHGVLCCELDADERAFARDFLKDLRKRERRCTRKTHARLQRVHVTIA